MMWKRCKLTLCGFLVCYCLIAIGTGFFANDEIFPFFNGHWFYQVPVEFHDYGLLITKIDNTVLEQPLYIEKIYSQFAVWPFAAYGAIQRWGINQEIQSDNNSTIAQSTKKLLFGSRTIQAKLVKRKINTLKFLENNQIEDAKVLLDVEN